MQNILTNLRFGIRMLWKSPGFTITAVLTLALGVGATTAIYTVVYATLLAPMPYPKPDQLVMVWSTVNGNRNGANSAGDFMDWKQRSTVFQNLVCFSGTSFNMAGKQEPEMIRGQYVSVGMYGMMGVPFAMGRDFLPEEGVAGKDHVVIITHKLWVRLGADPHILGKTITLDQKPYTVVGVFGAGQPDRLGWDVVVPLVFTPDQLNHDFHWLVTMGRLKDGVTLDQANAQMASVARSIAKDYPKSDEGWGVRVEPLQNDFLGDNFKKTLWMLLGAVGFLLLIACVNIANLLLAKGTTRQKEIAIRSAIGASRASVFSQFVTESLLLAGFGGVLGVGLGYGMLRGLLALMPQYTLPSEADVRLSIPVLLVTLAATTIAGLLFGCAPAWYASRVDPAESLKEGGRSGTSRFRNRLRQGLVVGEFALALTLLAGAGLAIHSFWNLNHIDLGIKTDHVLIFGLPMNKEMDYKPEQIVSYYQQIVRAIESKPGVEAATAATGVPLGGPGYGMPFTIKGQAAITDPSKRPGAGFGMVTPGYFETYGIRLVNGRFFNESDNAAGEHVAVVNEQLVRHYFAGKNPIGQILMVEQIVPGVTKLGAPQPWVIVGVYHDVRGGYFQRQREEILVPFAQSGSVFAEVGVRTAGDPETMIKTVSQAVHSVDPTLALSQVETLQQLHDEDLSGDRFTLFLYLIFAVIALLLAAVGIYGVMAFAVGQRSHEIGVRMALGANRGRMVRMILREGLFLAAAGLLLGLIGAWLVGRALSTTLYDVKPIDLSAFCAVGAVLILSALVASYFPARRASRVEPMKALRIE